MQYPRPHLRADGNLSYLQFIDVVSYLWNLSHPDIPIVPAGNSDPASYPSIVYSIQLTKTHPNEPKPRFREIIDKDADEAYLIAAQRFQNVVGFSAVTEAGDNPDTNVDNGVGAARLADLVIEAFEDFMLEFTPLFKRLGLSEIVYARRMPDREETRPGAGTVWRTVTYMVTTEKVRKVPAEKLRRIHLDMRIGYHQSGTFFICNDDDSIDIFSEEFKIGDLLAISYQGTAVPDPNLPAGIYTVSNIAIIGENRRYFLSHNDEPVGGFAQGTYGYIRIVHDDVETEIVDLFAHATPEQDFQ